MLSEESVWSTLRAIYDGKAKPRHSENVFERLARVRWFSCAKGGADEIVGCEFAVYGDRGVCEV